MIAIDGPAASGKTTIGQMLAKRLNYLFLDTGIMYRAVTLAALRQGVAIDDEAQVAALAQQLTLQILPAGDETDGRLYTVLLDDEDVTWALRHADVNAHVSQVSAYHGVRQELARRQRKIGAKGRVVMVGRDIGTVIMPDAPLKLYMDATAEERAQRRWREEQGRGGKSSLEAILADVLRRDRIDSHRQHSPLTHASDAIIVDTTGVSPEEAVEMIMALIGDLD